MIISDEILEKILRTAQLTGTIERVKIKSISLKELIEILNEYQIWSEQIFEKYYQESKSNYAQSLEIMKLKNSISELEKQIKVDKEITLF